MKCKKKSTTFAGKYKNKRFQASEKTNLTGMAKYNIIETGPKDAAYRSLVGKKKVKELRDQIFDTICKQKKYKEKDYSAKQLATDLKTNTRYISAVVSICFGMNYTSFVNSCRIKYAKTILSNKKFNKLRMDEISEMVGFSNRQSFYASFYKFTGITPRQYKLEGDKAVTVKELD